MSQQVSVTLSNDIVYVYGLVNGLEATFSLTSPGVWSATVPNENDDRYEVEITAYNSLGTATTYSTVIYYLEGLIPPKIDWKLSDTYNAPDLVRVEANIGFVANAMESAGYRPEIIGISTNWAQESIPFLSGINRIEGNIKALEEAFIAPPGWEEPVTNWGKGMPFDYNDANRLERNTLFIYQLLLNVIESFKFTGTFSCGEEGDIY